MSRSHAVVKQTSGSSKKRPVFVLFALAERTAAILDVALLCSVESAQCKTRELP